MTDPVKEQLSACLDGELPATELDLLLKQVQLDPRLPQSVTRYALISEVLRTGSSTVPSADFASRISQAIAAESDAHLGQHSVPLRARREMPRWLRPAGGAAIAAGVAALAVMIVQPDLEAGRQLDSATQSVANGTVPEAANDRYIVPSVAPLIVPATALAGYVMAHSEVAGPLNRGGALVSGVLADSDGEAEQGELTEPLAIDATSPAAADDTASQADSRLQRRP